MKGRNRDSSEHWKWGLFYYNADDPIVWVHKLYGMGWTLNLARPTSWFILLALLSLVLYVVLATLTT